MSLEGEMLGYSGSLNFARDGCVIQDKYLLFSKWGRDSEVNGGCRERTTRVEQHGYRCLHKFSSPFPPLPPFKMENFRGRKRNYVSKIIVYALGEFDLLFNNFFQASE